MPVESIGQLAAKVTTVGTTAVVVTGTAGSKGRISAILMNATATGIITIYDNASTNSGTVIGYIASGTVAGTFQAYDIPYVNGIVVYDAGAGGIVLTVVYTTS